jgi:hypothetical protein
MCRDDQVVNASGLAGPSGVRNQARVAGSGSVGVVENVNR